MSRHRWTLVALLAPVIALFALSGSAAAGFALGVTGSLTTRPLRGPKSSESKTTDGQRAEHQGGAASRRSTLTKRTASAKPADRVQIGASPRNLFGFTRATVLTSSWRALWLPESDPHDLAAQSRNVETSKRRNVETSKLETSKQRITTILATLMPRPGCVGLGCRLLAESRQSFPPRTMFELAGRLVILLETHFVASPISC